MYRICLILNPWSPPETDEIFWMPRHTPLASVFLYSVQNIYKLWNQIIGVLVSTATFQSVANYVALLSLNFLSRRIIKINLIVVRFALHTQVIVRIILACSSVPSTIRAKRKITLLLKVPNSPFPRFLYSVRRSIKILNLQD